VKIFRSIFPEKIFPEKSFPNNKIPGRNFFRKKLLEDKFPEKWPKKFQKSLEGFKKI
jgi:hypothetical protein